MADDPTTEYIPAEPSEETEGTPAEGKSKPSPRSVAAYREQQSRADRAEREAREARQQAAALQGQMQQLQQAVQDTQLRAQWSHLPEDERAAREAQHNWEQWQRGYARLQSDHQKLQAEHNFYLSQQGRIAKASELVAEHGLPKDVMGVPTLKFLMTHADSMEAMEALAKEIGGGKEAPTPKGATSKPQRYLSGEGAPVSRVPLHLRPEAEQDAIAKYVKGGYKWPDAVAMVDREARQRK